MLCCRVADYYRYLAEVNKTQEYIDNASANYKTAHELSALELTAANPIRLGVSLNYSVCVYELLGDDKTACTIAKDAFDKAIAEIGMFMQPHGCGVVLAVPKLIGLSCPLPELTSHVVSVAVMYRSTKRGCV